MKKATIILVSLLAIALTAGLVLTGCPQPAASGGGGGGDTYKGGAFFITVSNFNSTFTLSATDQTTLNFVDGSYEELKPKVNSAWDDRDKSVNPGEEGRGTLAQLKTWLQNNASEAGLTSNQINSIISKLDNPGYVIAYIGGKNFNPQQPGLIGVFAVYKE